MATEPKSEPWHLDRRIPIGLILTIIIQTVVVVWHLAGVTAQVEQNTSDIATNERSISIVSGQLASANIVAGRVEERLLGMKEQLDRIERRQVSAARQP